MVKVLVTDIGDGVKIAARVYLTRGQYLHHLKRKQNECSLSSSGSGTAAKFIGYKLADFVEGEELIIGECIFSDEHFTIDSIAHEVYHAVSKAGIELGKKLGYMEEDHEWAAHRIGLLTEKITKWYAEVKDGPYQRRVEVWSSEV